MLRTSKWFVAVAVVLLGGQACFASFSADLTMVSNLSDLNNVTPGAQMTVTIMDAQSYDTSGEGTTITGVQINFANSSSGLISALHAGSWSFGAAFAGGLVLSGSDMTDLNGGVWEFGLGGLTGSSPYSLGAVTFNAPTTYGTYTIRLDGGDGLATPDPTNTYINGASPATFLDIASSTNGTGGMTASTLTFTVMPEPATLALLGLGGLITLIRRRAGR